ncbi:hypothetical protein [Stenotrophomonas sepilia]|uniref:hypothetical protein n=1 Tax=Stenotrophomonas sepilia TaxID=2860290 RepID=UPI002E780A28|nr:hypothetical protein [Stenotrophomonas sepilia]
MTVSVIVFEPFKNDDKLAGFEHELELRAESHHRFADNVIFAKHVGSTRDLYEALKAAGKMTGLVLIEAKEVQDGSWIVDGQAFDWLNDALPNYKI